MMKKKVLMGILILIVLLFGSQMFWNNLYLPKQNIAEIKIGIIDLDKTEYVFKETENINKLLEIEKELRKFKLEKGILLDDVDIEFEVVYNNGIKIKKVFKKMDDGLLKEVYDSVEGRKQRVKLLYMDFSNVDKLILESHRFKNNSIEIKDKKIIDEIILGLREYALSDKFIDDFSGFNYVGVEFEEPKLSTAIASDNEKLFKLLKQEGIYNDLVITSSDIKEMRLIKGNTTLEITDKKIMDIALENCISGNVRESVVFLKATLKTSDDDKIYCSFIENRVPEEIEKLFE